MHVAYMWYERVDVCVCMRVFYLRRFSPLTHCKALARASQWCASNFESQFTTIKLRFYVYIKEYHFPMQQNEWTARKRKRDWNAKGQEDCKTHKTRWPLVRSCYARIRNLLCNSMRWCVCYFFPVCECLLLLIETLKLIFCWHKWFSCTEVLVRPERP